MTSRPLHPLLQRLAELRRAVRRLVAIQGAAAVIAALLAAVIVLGGIDFLVRFQDRGVLLIFSLAAAAFVGWAAYRFLFVPWRRPWNDTDLALRIEERLPVLGDRLASAVEFLHQSEGDTLAGSADLRRAVISQTAAVCERIDFKTVLDARAARRWAIGAVAIGLLAALLVAANPSAAAIAVTRLAAPLGSTIWPRSSHLALARPTVPIGRGQAFTVEVVDDRDARLPDDLKIRYRPLSAASSKTSVDTERMTVVGHSATARREQVTQGFQFRIEGGDSDPIDWTPVPVLDPPEVASLKIHREPPAYAHMLAGDDDSPLSLTVLAGTRLVLSATATKPLVAAWLVRPGQPEVPVSAMDAAAGQNGSKLLRAVWVADRSTTLSFRLIDVDKLTGGSAVRCEVHVVADAPPKVVIDLPTGNLAVTSNAVVPVQITAGDDLSLQQVALSASATVGGGPVASTQVLYTADGHVAARRVDPGSGQGEQRTFTAVFDVAHFAHNIGPGAQVKLIATASDFLPQTTASEPRTLTIITQADLLERMAARQKLLLSELARLLKIQSETREQVRTEQIRLHETHTLSQAEVDRLQSCELNERDVARSLSRGGDGAAAQVVALLADVAMNRLDNPELEKRLRDLLDEMDRLEREQQPPLAQALTAAAKAAQVALDPDAGRLHEDRIESALATTLVHQQAVIESLEKMLDRLRQWDDYQRFPREVAHLANDQDELARNTLALGRNTLTKDLKDLSPDELAALKVLAQRQAELARRLDRLEEEMGRTGETLRDRDPTAADALTDAQTESRQAAIAGTMRRAADGLQANRIGRVADDQTAVSANLHGLLDILSATGSDSLPRRVKKLDAARQQMGLMRKAQHDVRQGVEASGQAGDPAQRQAGLEQSKRDQDKLRAAADDLARRLQRLSANDAAANTADAAGKMGQASNDAGKGSADRAAQHAKAAEKDLEQADQKLGQALAQARAELLFEKMARIEDEVKHLRAQEQRILGDTREFDALGHAGALTAAQAAGLHDVAQLQADLHDELGHTVAATEPESVFRLALSAAGDDLALASTALERKNTGAAAQTPEQSAIDRMAQILEAIKPEDQQPKSGGAGGKSPPNNAPPSDDPAMLSELKLLRSLQADLNRRTKAMAEAVAAHQINDDEAKTQFDRLSDEQGRLAALTLKFLAKPAPQPPQEEP